MAELIGINHKTSALHIREKLYFTDDEAVTFMKHVLSIMEIEGMVVLSTCNRTEIYFDTTDKNVSKLLKNECLKFKEIVFAVPFYHLTGDECVLHLFKVSAGLDSLILREDQILGQLKDAYRLSTQNDCSSSIINRLFHKAFEAGKKIKTSFKLQQAPASAGSAAVEFIKDIIENPSETEVLIFGAGLMADKVAFSLKKNRFAKIRIFNRSLERATTLAQKHHLLVVQKNQLSDAIHFSQVIIVTTSALSPVLNADMIPWNEKRKICFDLSVPCNIDKNVENLEHVSLFTCDHLKTFSSAFTMNKTSLKQAEVIMDELLEEFNTWLAIRPLSPLITDLHEKFNIVLEKRLNSLKNKLSEKEYKLVRESGLYLKEKYLGSMVAGLKEISENLNKMQRISI